MMWLNRKKYKKSIGLKDNKSKALRLLLREEDRGEA